MAHRTDAAVPTPLAVPCPILVREYSGRSDEPAQLLGLHAGGLRFLSSRALDTGVHLQVRLLSASPRTPALDTAVSVLHCRAVAQGFDIAASIVEIEPVEYTELP